jgi:hypothetical protein
MNQDHRSKMNKIQEFIDARKEDKSRYLTPKNIEVGDMISVCNKETKIKIYGFVVESYYMKVYQTYNIRYITLGGGYTNTYEHLNEHIKIESKIKKN